STAGRKPKYRGCVVTDDMLIAIDGDGRSLYVYNRHGGKRITSHRLESWPRDVCLINQTEVAVCLGSEVVILSVTSRDGVKLVNTLRPGLRWCQSLVKWRSDKLVISGENDGDMLCWRILSITDGRLDSTHDICTGCGETHMAVREDTVYISCVTLDSITDNGVHAFNLLTNKQKFVYQHRELTEPWSIMADRDYVYVSDWYSSTIHQLTDSGQLVTIHTVSSRPWSMFYDDQQGLIYTTSFRSNVITVYKMESSRQEDSVIPEEVLKMDTRSLQIYKKALNEGKEKVYNIRVMVVGQYGVGKTTLTQRLLGKNVNISERHSTEGIDVHIECSKVSLSTGEWTTQEKTGREPEYACSGCVVTDDMLIAIGDGESYLHVYNRHVGKLITSHRLESWPRDVCLINQTEVAVCLGRTVVILSVTSRDGVKLVNTLRTGLYPCYSLVKWRSDKLVISGKKGGMLCWRILSITDGRLDSAHNICTGWGTRMAVREDTVYISCRTDDSITAGVYAFNLLTNKQKFLYRHRELTSPGSIMADRDYVYVCDGNRIHQLTDSGQLVTIHTVSSRPESMFYDDQHGLLYTTSFLSNVITVYKMESSRQQDSFIPEEVLKMDTRSLQIYKKALNEGKEKVYNIRVMVVGQYGVGKTTLTQRLLGKNVNISERHSTEGIDVHIECSKVSLSTGEWTTQEKNAEQYSRLQRLVRLLNEHSHKQESKKREQERQIVMDDQVKSVEYNNGHTQHNQLVSKESVDEHPQHDQPFIAEPGTNKKIKPPSSQPVKSPIVRLVP
ncbi:hypothetical protein ACJMK2_001274, partial [Sinanodonta woodiana]